MHTLVWSSNSLLHICIVSKLWKHCGFGLNLHHFFLLLISSLVCWSWIQRHKDSNFILRFQKQQKRRWHEYFFLKHMKAHATIGFILLDSWRPETKPLKLSCEPSLYPSTESFPSSSFPWALRVCLLVKDDILKKGTLVDIEIISAAQDKRRVKLK